MNMSPTDRNPPSTKKLKVVTALVCTLTLTAGISVASEGSKIGSAEHAEQSLHTRNGGPSLKPVKPSDDKTILETVKGLFS